MDWKGWINPLLSFQQALHTNPSYSKVETLVNKHPWLNKHLDNSKDGLVANIAQLVIVL
jgi:hypothetical protein